MFLFSTLNKIFQQKIYKIIFIILNIIFVLAYFFFNNFFSAVQIFNTSFFSQSEKLSIFFTSFFDISSLENILMLILVILFILSLSLFFILLLVLFNDSKKIHKKKSFLGILGIFISVLGLSCATCGIGLLASLLSLFGLSGLVVYFPLHGLEFGFLGLLVLNISNYVLIKRIKNPFVC